jgi:hypothetical protein
MFDMLLIQQPVIILLVLNRRGLMRVRKLGLDLFCRETRDSFVPVPVKFDSLVDD